jgi:tRNA(fMet)-specific endonuclease VapC
MRPLLIDTNAYAAFKRGDSNILDLIQQVEAIGISPIVLGELLAGFDVGNKAKQNRAELQLFLESSRIKTFNITSDTAHFFSQIVSSLRRKVRPIPTNDIWLAAQALENGCVICTYDRHFQEVDGLLVCSTLEGFTF